MIIAVPTHVASLCAFPHLACYVGVRALQLLRRKLQGVRRPSRGRSAQRARSQGTGSRAQPPRNLEGVLAAPPVVSVSRAAWDPRLHLSGTTSTVPRTVACAHRSGGLQDRALLCPVACAGEPARNFFIQDDGAPLRALKTGASAIGPLSACSVSGLPLGGRLPEATPTAAADAPGSLVDAMPAKHRRTEDGRGSSPQAKVRR